MVNPKGKPIFARFVKRSEFSKDSGNTIFLFHLECMKNKWYISALVFALILVGINLEQASVPNQEIVLQFADAEITLDETQDVIALVKEQLETVAVDDIKIQDLGNGRLKITYYSDIAVSEIKKILSGETSVAIDYTQNTDKDDTKSPLDKDLKAYQFDVFEIQETNSLADSSGNVLESKSETIRFFTPDTYVFNGKQSCEEKNKTEKLAYTAVSYTHLTLPTTPYV